MCARRLCCVPGSLAALYTSSETQGQLVGAGKRLRGREKNSGEEKSFLTFLRPNFFLARLDFFPPLLTAPGSPRMLCTQITTDKHGRNVDFFCFLFLLLRKARTKNRIKKAAKKNGETL